MIKFSILDSSNKLFQASYVIMITRSCDRSGHTGCPEQKSFTPNRQARKKSRCGIGRCCFPLSAHQLISSTTRFCHVSPFVVSVLSPFSICDFPYRLASLPAQELLLLREDIVSSFLNKKPAPASWVPAIPILVAARPPECNLRPYVLASQRVWHFAVSTPPNSLRAVFSRHPAASAGFRIVSAVILLEFV